jgi:hypothetical protein
MLTVQAGYDPGPDALERICRLPLSVINAERVFRKVHGFKTDRKAYEDQRPRIARQGRVQQGGQAWTCRELQAYQGDRVIVLVPKYEDWTRLPIQDESGSLLGFAEPDRAYAMLDAEMLRIGSKFNRKRRTPSRVITFSRRRRSGLSAQQSSPRSRRR